jgi:hypothetical protein
MNLKNDITKIIEWFHFGLNMLIDLINKKDYISALLLIDDIRYVILAYFQAVAGIAPDDITPFPKNFFSQLSWIGKNINWLKLFTGSNPFEIPAQKAKAISEKWGFGVKS